MIKLKASDVVEIDETFIYEVSKFLKPTKEIEYDDSFVEKVAEKVATILEEKKNEKKEYSVSEVAEILGVGIEAVRRYIHNFKTNKPISKKLNADKHTKSWIIKKEYLDEFTKTEKNHG